MRGRRHKSPQMKVIRLNKVEEYDNRLRTEIRYFKNSMGVILFKDNPTTTLTPYFQNKPALYNCLTKTERLKVK